MRDTINAAFEIKFIGVFKYHKIKHKHGMDYMVYHCTGLDTDKNGNNKDFFNNIKLS
jgi:hypothetical protein